MEDPNQGLALVGELHAEQPNQHTLPGKSHKPKKGKLFDLAYDKLVIAVGCYSQTFGTPGVKDHALFLKDVGDARKIRNRLLVCFEAAALPTTSDDMRKCLLNFAIVGGGPTGIEFSAELHDFIVQDLSRIYPELMKFVNVTVYDVAPKVLSMFDEKLGAYAIQVLSREGVKIRTSHHVEELRQGPPASLSNDESINDQATVWTLKTREDGEIGVGMVVWSTGLQMNPFVEVALGRTDFQLPSSNVTVTPSKSNQSNPLSWMVKKMLRVAQS